MINFGLKPCPLCGGEAEVVRLTQGPEELSAVIKCTDCGLTLEWETKIKVGISRVTGRKTAEKVGLDPVEAWNQRYDCNDCENCSYMLRSNELDALHNCNDCGKLKGCEYAPPIGATARINCPLWRAEEE